MHRCCCGCLCVCACGWRGHVRPCSVACPAHQVWLCQAAMAGTLLIQQPGHFWAVLIAVAAFQVFGLAILTLVLCLNVKLSDSIARRISLESQVGVRSQPGCRQLVLVFVCVGVSNARPCSFRCMWPCPPTITRRSRRCHRKPVPRQPLLPTEQPPSCRFVAHACCSCKPSPHAHTRVWHRGVTRLRSEGVWLGAMHAVAKRSAHGWP